MHEWVFPLVPGFKGAQSLAFIIVLVWLCVGISCTDFWMKANAQEQLHPRCVLVWACSACKPGNPIKLGGLARLRSSASEWAGLRITKDDSLQHWRYIGLHNDFIWSGNRFFVFFLVIYLLIRIAWKTSSTRLYSWIMGSSVDCLTSFAVEFSVQIVT